MSTTSWTSPRCGEHLDLAIEAVDPDRLLAECVQQVTPLAIDHDIQLHYQPPAANEMLVRADPRRLTQVVTNLLSNAIKYNRPGGRVDITYQVSDTSRNLDITVADTGRGIAPHDFPRLFLPFDRIDADVNHIRGNRAGSDIVPRPDDSNGRNARSHLPGGHRQHLHRLPPTDPN